MDKLAILRHLAQVPDATASDVADALEAALPAAGMALLRLVRAGLVDRALDVDRGAFCYRITRKGRDRLLYFSRRVP